MRRQHPKIFGCPPVIQAIVPRRLLKVEEVACDHQGRRRAIQDPLDQPNKPRRLEKEAQRAPAPEEEV